MIYKNKFKYINLDIEKIDIIINNLNLKNKKIIIFSDACLQYLSKYSIDIFFKNERWYCFEMHSSVCATNKIDFLSLINNKLNELREYLITASHIVLTFGTSWVYRFLKTKKIVANCFKIPQKEFQKDLLSIEEIKTSYNNIVTQILSRNPDTQIITTISPVRHLREGLIENNRSKAHLITVLQQLVFEEKKVSYFPSYELMLDELRDYRFYKEDMIHPNDTAIKIIWEFFKKLS